MREGRGTEKRGWWGEGQPCEDQDSVSSLAVKVRSLSEAQAEPGQRRRRDQE